jgi:hypothetical protein
VGEGECDLEDLLDEENRGAAPVDLAEDLREVFHEKGRQPFRRLVHQHELGAGHETAGDGEHLLLASRERLALLLVALTQAREVPEHFLDHRAVALGGGGARAEQAQPEVLGHAQVGQDAALLGHVGDARPRHLVGGEAASAHGPRR